MFNYHQKSAANIQIRNVYEFKQFLTLNLFQKKHLLDLMALSFDPTFTFKGIYYNMAKQINRDIHIEKENITLNTVISNHNFPRLNKLVEMFFKIPRVKFPRYVTIPDTPFTDIKL